MKKTANYGLNLWEKADRIQMEDFNADNAKIEAALAELKASSPFVTLADVTVTNEVSQVNFDLSNYDLTQFSELKLYLNISSSSSDCIFVRTNNISDTSYCGATGYGSYKFTTNSQNSLIRFHEAIPCWLTFIPPSAGKSVVLRMERAERDTNSLDTTLDIGSSAVTWDQLTSLNFIPNGGTIHPGSRLILTGMKL